ncbi:MAG: ribosome maturation factor RimP [Spirochaetia bacterium]
MDWKHSNRDEDRITEVIEPLLKGFGYCIVELKVKQIRDGNSRIHLVIHNPSGVTVDDCSRVYKAVLPVLTVTMDTQDVHLEVSSPGITRNVKEGRELACFIGREIAFMLPGRSEWTEGLLLEAGPEEIRVRTGGAETTVPLSDLKKAKLA